MENNIGKRRKGGDINLLFQDQSEISKKSSLQRFLRTANMITRKAYNHEPRQFFVETPNRLIEKPLEGKPGEGMENHKGKRRKGGDINRLLADNSEISKKRSLQRFLKTQIWL